MPTEHSEIDPSIEDPEVARLMNEVFVSIKVDREERPDIDNIYMGVCQMMTGSGGWPHDHYDARQKTVLGYHLYPQREMVWTDGDAGADPPHQGALDNTTS